MEIGLIGLGDWGKNILRALQANQRVTKVHSIGRQDDISKFKVDFVFIATPTPTHFDLAQKCLSQGTSVCLEKPATGSTEKLSQLIELSQANGAQFFVDHIYLFSPFFLEYKKQFPNVLLGSKSATYISVRGDWGKFTPDTSIFPQLMYHDLYILDQLVGLRNLKVESAQQTQTHSKDQTDWGKVVLKDSKGTLYHLTSSLIEKSKIRKISLLTDKKSLVWDDLASPEKRIQYNDQNLPVPNHQAEPLAQMIESTLYKSDWSPHSAQYSLQVLKFLEKIEAASRGPDA